MQIAKKGNSMRGFLRRNWKVNNEDTKITAYFSLVMLRLEYCCTVWNWNPAHRKLLRTWYNVEQQGSSPTATETQAVLLCVGSTTVGVFRVQTHQVKLNMMFKIMHGLVDIPPDKYLTPASSRTRSHHGQKLRQTKAPSSSLRLSVTEIPRRHLLSMLPLAILHGRALSSSLLINARAGQMQVNP